MTGSEQALAAGFVGAYGAMLMVFSIVIWVLFIVARWKIFSKAGEAGWKSIIPIYSDYVQWRIGWKKIGLFWVALLLMVGGVILGSVTGAFSANASSNVSGIVAVICSACFIASLVINLVAVYKLFASYGHGAGWFIGYLFIPAIMLLVLGLGSSQYYGPQD